MNEIINITNKNGSLVVSSREVATHFEKRHSDVTKAIQDLINKGSAEKVAYLYNQFIYSEYQNNQNGQYYPEYLLTKDGFSLLVMGFTGEKAFEWKLKYIEAFNRMEKTIKKHGEYVTENLSPQLQLLINMELKQKELETSLFETKEEVQAIRDTIIINPKAEWRKETNRLLTKMGVGLNDFANARNEAYKALEIRAHCRPKILIENLKLRALKNGMSQSKVDDLCLLDVLENETRLREIYINIVKEMAIKYKIV